MKITRNLVVRTGFASVPVTAFAPLAGAAVTGSGAVWLVLPAGSFAAIIGGACARSRVTPFSQHGVVLDAPQAVVSTTGPAPRGEVTVEFAWSDEAA